MTYADLQEMEIGEFFDHLIAARKRVAAFSIRLMGAIAVFSPGVKEEFRKAALKAVEANRTFGDGGDDIRAIYEDQTPEERLRIIGCVLCSKAAPHWRQANHGQLEWLVAHGFSEDDAVRAYTEWRGRLTAAEAT